MRNYLDRLACELVYDVLSSLLKHMRRPSPLLAAPFPRQGILNCLREEKSGLQTRKQATWPFPISLILEWNVTGCQKRLPSETLGMTALDAGHMTLVEGWHGSQRNRLLTSIFLGTVKSWVELSQGDM